MSSLFIRADSIMTIYDQRNVPPQCYQKGDESACRSNGGRCTTGIDTEGVHVNTEPYPIGAGLFIRKAVT